MNAFKNTLILWLSRFLCYALHLTYRYKIINPPLRIAAENMTPRRTVAIASWHQNCFAGILSHHHQNIALLISRSFDGTVINAVSRALGHDAVRGSSRKGGREALQEMIERSKKGQMTAFTIDGPKGPLYSVKRGVLELSAATGNPVLPLLAIGDRYWTLQKTWDKFRLPKPFARISVIYGQPFVVVDLEERLEEWSEKLKSELLSLEQQAWAQGYVSQHAAGHHGERMADLG